MTASHQQPEVTFREESHAYFIGEIRVPNVTSVLQDVGIIDYSFIAEGTRIMALERGRQVHQICHYDDENDLMPFPRYQGYLDAWRRFRDERRFVPDLIEHRGYCAAFGYAGTLDRRGFIDDQKDPAFVDIKTNLAPYWTKFQTAAYAQFFPSPAKYRRMAVELHPDGTYKSYEYRCAEFSQHLNVFLSALNVYNAKLAE